MGDKIHAALYITTENPHFMLFWPATDLNIKVKTALKM
jgi:hypothetical protein